MVSLLCRRVHDGAFTIAPVLNHHSPWNEIGEHVTVAPNEIRFEDESSSSRLLFPLMAFEDAMSRCSSGSTATSVTLWLSKGLRLEQSDPSFKRRLDQLDARISADR